MRVEQRREVKTLKTISLIQTRQKVKENVNKLTEIAVRHKQMSTGSTKIKKLDTGTQRS